MRPARFLQDDGGSASTEFALVLPLMILLLFVGSEAGHFVWTQHKLTEAVRNGARYASRLQIDNLCDGGSSTLADPELSDVKRLTRTGQLASSTATPVVPGWTDAQVDVVVTCDGFVSTGIYGDLDSDGDGTGEAGPVVTVSASGVTYPSLFNLLGGLSRSVTLTAKSNAPVIAL
jgi:Flp pilus assembly protein TadG